MPYVVNGIGTWYWGKSNVFARRDQCQHCGRLTDLRSYDTTKYFVVLFLPIIPLGRKRIIDECPHCKRHRVASAKQWRRQKAEAMAAAQSALRAEPNSDAAVRSAIGACVAFQSPEELDNIAALLGPSARNSAENQSLLGSAYGFFDRYADAERAYRAALAIQPATDISEALAVAVLHQKRPDEAWQLLQHVLKKQDGKAAGLLLLVAEGYQEWGMHQEALTVLDAAVAAFPDMAGHKDYKRVRRSSEKHRATGRKITSAHLASAATPAARPRSGKWPKLAFPAFLLIVVAGYVMYANAQGRSREAYLVNGLDHPYKVTVAGATYTIPPGRPRAIHLSEGKIDVRVAEGGPPIPPQTCEITTPLLTRPIRRETFVINPDLTAVLVWEEAAYAAEASAADAKDVGHAVRVGLLLYSFTGLDYAFQEFPDSVRMSEHAGTVTKSRVYQFQESDFRTLLGIIASEAGEDAATDYIEHLAQYEPNNDLYLSVLMSIKKPAELLPILRPRLGARPVNVPVHRMYQECCRKAEPDHDLVAEYTEYVDAEPDNADLIYLRGRLETDPIKAGEYFRRASECNTPSAYAYYARGFDRLADAQYAEALELARKALALVPESTLFKATERQALAGCGRFDELLELHQRDPVPFLSAQPTEYELYLLLRSGRDSEASELIRGVVSEAKQAGNPEQANYIRNYLEAITAYVRGDADTYTARAEQSGDRELLFGALVMAGRMDEAAIAAADLEHGQAYLYLLLYALAADGTAHGGGAINAERAERLLQLGTDALRAGSDDEQLLADWLTGSAAPHVDRALRFVQYPEQKRVAMVALAARFPEDRDKYLAMARRLNVDRRFPYLVISRLAGDEENE